jgi:hypothetical protein
MAKRPSKKPPACAISRVWGYPATEDNAGPIHWAWRCRCGKGGDSYETEAAAYKAAAEHWYPEG